MKNQYNKTITACFVGYIVQAVVNNFVPLLFLHFQTTYEIPLSQITLLVTFNFGIQLLIDLISVVFVDKIGYRASMILAHALSASGLLFHNTSGDSSGPVHRHFNFCDDLCCWRRIIGSSR